jgi:hypothetical protein
LLTLSLYQLLMLMHTRMLLLLLQLPLNHMFLSLFPLMQQML